jgi:hypothetical protein
MLSFVHEGSPARVLFGAGRRQQLPDEVGHLGIERALLITTPSQRAEAEALAARLGARAAGVFDRVVMHVPVEVAEAGRAEAKRAGAVRRLARRHRPDRGDRLASQDLPHAGRQLRSAARADAHRHPAPFHRLQWGRGAGDDGAHRAGPEGRRRTGRPVRSGRTDRRRACAPGHRPQGDRPRTRRRPGDGRTLSQPAAGDA